MRRLLVRHRRVRVVCWQAAIFRLHGGSGSLPQTAALCSRLASPSRASGRIACTLRCGGASSQAPGSTRCAVPTVSPKPSRARQPARLCWRTHHHRVAAAGAKPSCPRSADCSPAPLGRALPQVAIGVARNGLRPAIPAGVHPGLVALMQRCWATDPSTRPEFVELLEHLPVRPPPSCGTCPPPRIAAPQLPGRGARSEALEPAIAQPPLRFPCSLLWRRQRPRRPPGLVERAGGRRQARRQTAECGGQATDHPHAVPYMPADSGLSARGRRSSAWRTVGRRRFSRQE